MIDINGKSYKELHCSKCQKLICYQNISAGIVFYQCSRCGYANEFIFKYYKNDENVDEIKKEYQINPKGGEL
jgi:phage FluMu protein Com